MANRKVAIFGGGISGLTAAHELIERGFEVHVYERLPRVGGMARTQQASVPPAALPEPTPPPPLAPLQRAVRWREEPLAVQPVVRKDGRLLVARQGVAEWDLATGKWIKTYGGYDLYSHVAFAQPAGSFFAVRGSQQLWRWQGSWTKVADLPGACVALSVGKKGAPLVAVAVLPVPDDAAQPPIKVISKPGTFERAPDPTWEDRCALSKLRACFDAQDRLWQSRDDVLVSPSGAPSPPVPAPTSNTGDFSVIECLSATATGVAFGGLGQVGTWDGNGQNAATCTQVAGACFTAVREVGDAATGGPVLWAGTSDGRWYKVHANSATSLGQLPNQDRIVDLWPDPTSADRTWLAWRDRHTGEVRVGQFEDASATNLREVERTPRRMLPGEHGFRFFPSYYLHLNDTLSRVPLGDGTPRTAIDLLRPTLRQGIGAADGRQPYVFHRDSSLSSQEMVDTLYSALAGLDYTARDIARFQLKVFQFMTTCWQRRLDLDGQSWWDFVGGDAFSKRAQDDIQGIPKVLVAVDAKQADAHSQGATFVQLLADQAAGSGSVDRVMAGPISDGWLDPWQRWLTKKGVQFHHGYELTRFGLAQDPSGGTAGPWVAHLEPTDHSDSPVPAIGPVAADYFVLALQPSVLARVVRATAAETPTWKPTGDLEKCLNFPVQRTTARMYGIQFFLPVDVTFLRGHFYFPTSAWGLSSVSQAQFSPVDMDEAYGIKGILSVIIGDWDTPARDAPPSREPHWWSRTAIPGKTARQCTPEEIAQETWRQVHASVCGGHVHGLAPLLEHTDTLPWPLAYHLDEFVHNGSQAKDPVKLREGYLINTTDTWELRPGDLDGPGYALVDGVFTVAGNLPRTFTRVATMESANESARRAVNAILSDPASQFYGELCALWPMEEREPRDLQALKRLDEMLHGMGLPHMFDILDVWQWIDQLMAHAPGESAEDLFARYGLPPILAEWLEKDWLVRDHHQRPRYQRERTRPVEAGRRASEPPEKAAVSAIVSSLVRLSTAKAL